MRRGAYDVQCYASRPRYARRLYDDLRPKTQWNRLDVQNQRVLNSERTASTLSPRLRERDGMPCAHVLDTLICLFKSSKPEAPNSRHVHRRQNITRASAAHSGSDARGTAI